MPRVEDKPLTDDLWNSGDVKIVDLHSTMRTSQSIFISDNLISAIRDNPPVDSPWILYFNRLSGDGYKAEDIKQALDESLREFKSQILSAENDIPKEGIAISTKTFFHKIDILSPKISGIAILNADREFILRGFRTMERATGTIRRLVSIARSAGVPCIIQTFDTNTIKKMLSSTKEIYDNELSARKLLGYPPYKDIVIKSVSGAKVEVRKTKYFEPIEEWLTTTHCADIITNPDRYDFAHFDPSKPKS